MSPPTIFVSYSHDSAEHKAWVIKLATDLRAHGVDVSLDEWDLALGQDIAAFMQRGIAASERVLLICSETYVRKAEAGAGGVGYERLIVSAEIVQNIGTKKFIPIVRDNPGLQKTPGFLGARRYVDFTRDEDYVMRLNELLREIHGVGMGRPQLGPNPFQGTVAQGQSISRIAGPTGLQTGGEPVLEEPWFTGHVAPSTAGLARLGLRGSMELRYALHDAINKSQLELLNAVRRSEIHTFGWPIAMTIENQEEYRPRPMADGIRAEIAIPERVLSESSSYDYWALRNNGDFFLLKSLFEDERAASKIFFNTRIVRVTESLLFATRLYENLGVASETRVSIRVTHRGLAGRELSSSNRNRDVFPARSVEDVSQSQIVETLAKMRGQLVANVRQIAESLFMLFNFTEFSAEVYEDIVTNFVAGRVT